MFCGQGAGSCDEWVALGVLFILQSILFRAGFVSSSSAIHKINCRIRTYRGKPGIDKNLSCILNIIYEGMGECGTMENGVLLRKQVLLVPVLHVFPPLPDDLCSNFHKPRGSFVEFQRN